MYIRRKVYSVLTDDYGYERLFSTNDVLLNGYDTRYFSDDYASGRDTGALIGGALGLGAAGAGGYYVNKHADEWARKVGKNTKKAVSDLKNANIKKILEQETRNSDALLRAGVLNDLLEKEAVKNGLYLDKKTGEYVLNDFRGASDKARAEGIKGFEKALRGKSYKNAAGETIKLTADDLVKFANDAKKHDGASWKTWMQKQGDEELERLKASLSSEEKKAIREIEGGGKNGLARAWRELGAKGGKAGQVATLAGLGLLGAYGASKVGGAIGGASNKRR